MGLVQIVQTFVLTCVYLSVYIISFQGPDTHGHSLLICLMRRSSVCLPAALFIVTYAGDGDNGGRASKHNSVSTGGSNGGGGGGRRSRDNGGARRGGAGTDTG